MELLPDEGAELFDKYQEFTKVTFLMAIASMFGMTRLFGRNQRLRGAFGYLPSNRIRDVGSGKGSV
jgi:hypothetical protein